MGFSVASYNVLADAYVHADRYPGVPPALLPIGHRKPLLCDRVAGLGADVICLQEVESDVYKALDERLQPLGYEGRYARKGRGLPDGCAAFVRTAALEVRADHVLLYADGWAPESFTGYVALLLLLEWGGRPVGVIDTHLKWDPPGTPRAAHRGYREIMQLLDEWKARRSDCPAWVLCGDFNATDDSDILQAVRAAGFVDAYAGRRHQATFSRQGEAKRIDYLFHTPDLVARPADLPALDAARPLPSPREPSDHLPILAHFDWAA
jgi:endonuclease/exonuclease/phosphatase family metal-dependent hydrolase